MAVAARARKVASFWDENVERHCGPFAHWESPAPIQHETVEIVTALLDDPERIAALGERKRTIALERFSVEDMAVRYFQLYRDLSVRLIAAHSSRAAEPSAPTPAAGWDRLGPSDDAGRAPAGTTVLSPAGLAAADAGASFASGFRADPSIAAPCRRSIWPQIGRPANAPGNMTPENALFANQATNRFLSGELSGEGGR
jgi:hypothetical protein